MTGPRGESGPPGPGAVGRELELEVGAVAHGGHCVARVDDAPDGRVVFVRHALPGERVVARVTEGADDDAFWRADAVAVLRASPDRVQPACRHAGPGLCGGCDWQHATPRAQRALKAAVVREQLRRLAGLDREVVVEAVQGPGVDAERGLGWRTRVQHAVDGEGRLGYRRHRSHDLLAVEECPISGPRLAATGHLGQRWPGLAGVEVVAPAAGEDRLVVVTPRRAGSRTRVPPLPVPTAAAVAEPAAPGRRPAAPHGQLHRLRGRTWVSERVLLDGVERSFRVTGSGFWQVHPGAADALVPAVLEGLQPRPGERAVDLYAGVGLFAAALALRVGEAGSVVAVESDRRAVADARRSLHDLPQVRLEAGRVDAVLGRLGDDGADVVVLDPPRAGAKRRVVELVAALRPRAVAYVACDPAALARDLATFAELGYAAEGLRAFDLFPQTAHVECVAVLRPR